MHLEQANSASYFVGSAIITEKGGKIPHCWYACFRLFELTNAVVYTRLI